MSAIIVFRDLEMRCCCENWAITATRSVEDSSRGARSTRTWDMVVPTTERVNIMVIRRGSAHSAQSSQGRRDSPGECLAHLANVIPALEQLTPRVVELCLHRGQAGNRRSQLPAGNAQLPAGNAQLIAQGVQLCITLDCLITFIEGRLTSGDQLRGDGGMQTRATHKICTPVLLGEGSESCLLVQYDDAVIDVNAVNVLGPHRLNCIVLVIAVQIIQARLDPLHEGAFAASAAIIRVPIGGVAVFDEIYATLIQHRKERLDRGDLLDHTVTTVIDDHIKRTVLLRHLAHGIWVSLIRKNNRISVTGRNHGDRVDVNADKARVWSEESGPHTHGPAAVDPDLQHGHRASRVRRQMSGVDREVMDPLVENVTGLVCGKKRKEWIVDERLPRVRVVESSAIGLIDKGLVGIGHPERIANRLEDSGIARCVRHSL